MVFLCLAEKSVLWLRRKKTSHETVNRKSVWRLREAKIRVRSSESDFRERWEGGEEGGEREEGWKEEGGGKEDGDERGKERGEMEEGGVGGEREVGGRILGESEEGGGRVWKVSSGSRLLILKTHLLISLVRSLC